MRGACSPRIGSGGSSACCVFPFGFTEEAILFPGALTQRVNVVLGILPSHADDGVGVVLSEAEFAPGHGGVELFIRGSSPGTAAGRWTICGGSEGGPLATRDIEFARGKSANVYAPL